MHPADETIDRDCPDADDQPRLNRSGRGQILNHPENDPPPQGVYPAFGFRPAVCQAPLRAGKEKRELLKP